jgi:hypothetical protein
LGIGEIGEDFLRGLGNNVLTLRHSVPRFKIGILLAWPFGHAASDAAFSCAQ